MSEHEKSGFFARLKRGMEESIAYSRGELSLKTTKLPAPPPETSSVNVIALRKRLRMSQSIFAAALNVSVKLVQSWEQGARKPNNGELRLIELLTKDPEIICSLILATRPTELGPRKRRNRKSGSRNNATAA